MRQDENSLEADTTPLREELRVLQHLCMQFHLLAGKTKLMVATPVDPVRVEQCQLGSAEKCAVDSLPSESRRVVLVADLVLPRSESTTAVDVVLLKRGQQGSKSSVTSKRGSGVSGGELAVVGRDDLVISVDEVGVDASLDGLGKDLLRINGLEVRLGNLHHERPVRSLLGLLRGSALGGVSVLQSRELDVSLGAVVWRVVGEDGSTVEGAVILGEVEPALVTDTGRKRATDTDTDNVGRRRN